MLVEDKEESPFKFLASDHPILFDAALIMAPLNLSNYKSLHMIGYTGV
jgi:hypothetical protein